jgi:hypothetical protein
MQLTAHRNPSLFTSVRFKKIANRGEIVAVASTNNQSINQSSNQSNQNYTVIQTFGKHVKIITSNTTMGDDENIIVDSQF